ncbi:MAG: hypothetical protein HUK08_02110, partial [Bacteroidaceae bacterium]|nr:hypothetical protein [Bacteroidaceae bacterium]
ADDKFTSFAIHSCDEPATPVNSRDDELPEIDPDPEQGYFIEIPQDQGKQYDDFARTSMVKGDDYTTYTATGDLQIAFKMMNIDVKNCDYVVVRFAEPVKAGWKIAFWEGTNTMDVPEGATEFKFELEASMKSSGVLPQICLMTLFGGYTPPLTAMVTGVYKHSTEDDPSAISPTVLSATSEGQTAYYSLSGTRIPAPGRGVNIVRTADGKVKKVLGK